MSYASNWGATGIEEEEEEEEESYTMFRISN
jgi:hypothetical protein